MGGDLSLVLGFSPQQPAQFLEFWLGAPVESVGVEVDPRLPAALKRWFDVVDRWGLERVVQHNRVPTSCEFDGDWLLVCVENQGVWLWGVQGPDSNPYVHDRENEPSVPCTSTGQRLDQFLWQLTIFEAILGTTVGAGVNDVTTQELDRFTAGWQSVPVPQWGWPGPAQSLWFRDNVLAWTMVNGPADEPLTAESLWSIFVAARSPEDLETMTDGAILWDWDSRAG